jgi:outer membrane protein
MMRLCVFTILVLVPASGFTGSTLDFESAIQAAVRHSYDVRMSLLDVGISRSGLREIRALYFPELSARFNSQHVQDMTSGVQQVTAVGTTIIVRNTLYQDSLSLNAQWSLYDFGARENRVLAAATDIPLKEAVHRQSIRDTKLKVLEIYRDLLLAANELKTKRQVLPLYKELSLTRERLYAAGLASRIEMGDEAIKVVRIVDALETLQARFVSGLKDLSYYTGHDYPTEGVEIASLTENKAGPGFDVSRTPEHRIYELAIQKKQAEIGVIRKQLLFPQFSLYSNYILYGQNSGSYALAFRDVGPVNLYVGLMATVLFFDGFKNSAQVERARQELDRLKVERDKKLQDLITRHEKLKEEARLRAKGLENQADVEAKTQDNLTMVSRLTDEKVAEYIEFLNRKIELLTQRWEVEKSSVLKAAALREMEILSEASN